MSRTETIFEEYVRVEAEMEELNKKSKECSTRLKELRENIIPDKLLNMNASSISASGKKFSLKSQNFISIKKGHEEAAAFEMGKPFLLEYTLYLGGVEDEEEAKKLHEKYGENIKVSLNEEGLKEVTKEIQPDDAYKNAKVYFGKTTSVRKLPKSKDNG